MEVDPLTGQRDADLVILEKMDDRTLFDFCNASKLNKYGSSLCSNEYFWKRRFISHFGEPELKPTNWKKFYISVVHYLSAASNDHMDATKKAIEKGDLIVVNFLFNKISKKLSRNVLDLLFALSAKYGHRDLVEYFIKKGANNFNLAMSLAAQGNHLEIIKTLISYGANNWNLGMYSAAEYGHLNLVEFFINKGARNFSIGLRTAAEGGHLDVIQFFKERVKSLIPAFQGAVLGNKLNILKWLFNNTKVNMDKTSWELLLISAARNGFFDILQFLLNKHRYDKKELIIASNIADEGGFIEIVAYLEDKLSVL